MTVCGAPDRPSIPAAAQPTRLASFSSTARVEVERIRRGAAALQLLQAEPGLANWASQLHHLLPYPELLLEALIMSQQVSPPRRQPLNSQCLPYRHRTHSACAPMYITSTAIGVRRVVSCYHIHNCNHVR